MQDPNIDKSLEKEIVRRHLAGEAYRTLADEHHLSDIEVLRIVRGCDVDVNKEDGMARAMRQRQTMQLEVLYEQAMSGWQASRLPQQTYKATSEGSAGGEKKDPKQRVEQIREEQCGDVRLLNAARGALEDIRKLWGLQSAELTPGEMKVEVFYTENWNHLSLEPIEEEEDLADRAVEDDNG